MIFANEDVIIACSTSSIGRAGIAVIRISGPIEPMDFSSVLWGQSGSIEPRKATLLEIRDDTRVLDQVVATYFVGPRSFTGENTLELSVHGNPVNVERIIDLFVSKFGLRRAAPGEFTFRALKNKKLSLSQVEGLDLLLNAGSYFALDCGQKMLSGKLDDSFLSLKKKFLQLKSHLELNIDFSEDVGEAKAWELISASFEDFYGDVLVLWGRGSIEPETILSPKIVLFGDPNSGKSTLFNMLVRSDRSIVSPTAGTTRDYISEKIDVDGVQFEVVDTAGLRETEDLIESEGISRAVKLIEGSFYKILLQDVRAINPSYEDLDCDMTVYTHTDQGKSSFVGKDGSMGANLLEEDISGVLLDKALSKFKEMASKEPIVVPRHRDLVEKIYNRTNDFKSLLAVEKDIAILASELGIIERELDELLGQITPDHVLSNIFNNFCIGK